MANTLADKIQGLSKAKGLSLSDLSREAKLEKSTVAGYWNGPGEPPFSKLKAIADALEVRAGYFFEEIPELDGLPFEQVVAFESLRFLRLKHGLPEDHVYRRLLRDSKACPKTLADWELFHRRTVVIRGEA